MNDLENILDISFGDYDSCTVTKDGELSCDNNPALKIPNATSVSVGDAHACAIEDEQTIKCWGSNSFGQLGNGTDLDSESPVEIIFN